jgi:DNA (cytosine-5)-methyltransferase 1
MDGAEMKLGGLFSGIGGFELAWTQLGHEVAWMCEIDKKARKVLEARFPGVPIYEDVEQLDPYEVEAVDVLTGGSPCQGFSIAGQRTGLKHGESRLFSDYVRIMEGLAERGLKYALWENVPGVLSIKNPDGERTFPHVIGALVGAGEPVRLDPKRKWNVGLASHAGRAVSWRILDSRYFGVAQRRRRVFACVAFGGACEDRAGRALLAVAEGVRGDSAEGVAAGEGAAGSVAAGAGGSGAVLMTMREGRDGGGKGPLLSEEESLTLATGNGQTLFQPEWAANHTGAFQSQAFKGLNHEEVRDVQAVVQAPDPYVLQGTMVNRKEKNGPGGFGWQRDTSYTLHTADPDFIAGPSYGVRRLTPVECERLQAFPDGWTEPSGSDSARYKALGNAVTVNTVRWILQRMANA